MSEKFRLRRTMMFANAQKPSLVKDAYIYKPDSLIIDLEDAVSENQKDSARFSLYHILKTVNFRGVERLVRINALDTPHWQEDIRVCVAGGADGIRLAKCESAQDVIQVEKAVEEAEEEFGMEKGKTLLMAALESPGAVLNAVEICKASPRLFGIALSGGDYRRCMHTRPTISGSDIQAARGYMVMAARATGVQCFDTVFTDLDDMDGFRRDVILDKEMGFDGKSIVKPRQIKVVHQIFAPTPKEITEAERVVSAVRENAEKGIGVFMLNGKMLDIAFVEGAQRTIALAKASGVYKGEL